MSKTLGKYLGFVLVIALILVTKFSFHELWKDEWQAYLVARDMGLGEMLSFLNYEGHPSLWYLYLKFWAAIGATAFRPTEEILVAVAHAIPVVLAAYLLFFKLPGNLAIKLLLGLSYAFAFEYGVVNRGYILVVVFTLLSTYLIHRKAPAWQVGISLLLLCQTEVYGVLMAFCFMVYLFAAEKNWNPIDFLQKKKVISSLALLGFVIFVFTVYPRGNEDDFSRAYIQQGIDATTIAKSFQGNLANAFLPGLIKDTAAHGTSVMGLLLSLFLCGGFVYLWKNQRAVAVAFFVYLLAMIAFGSFVFTGGIRQWSMNVVFFIALLFLRPEVLREKGKMAFVVLVGSVMLVHSGRAFWADVQIPFSNAVEAGEFIKEKVPEKVPVVVINKFETAAVGAYADRPLHELPSGNEFTYFKWLEKVYLPTEKQLKLFAKFKGVGGIVLLTSRPIDPDRFPNAEPWMEFNSENFKNENFYLYSLKR